jgi:hypothetical protein
MQNAINARSFTTAKALREALYGLNITGAAADAILKETAQARAEARIEQAKAAALAAASAIYAGAFTDAERAALASAICRLDYVGVGGTDGCTGEATTRLEPFRTLGSGRKNARDGAAWTAAIREAGYRLAYVARLQATPSGRIEVWTCSDAPGGGRELSTHQANLCVTLLPDAWLPWMRTLAREGLRRAAGIGRQFELLPLLSGDLSSWAKAVNDVDTWIACAEGPAQVEAQTTEAQ